ncbi:MAG: hypothetical protein ACYCT9_02950 [Leptospirillum sp.]
MASLELSQLARILVDLSDRPVLYWARSRNSTSSFSHRGSY